MNWFWHALWIAFVIIPVTLLWMFCLVDTFLRHDLGGWAKVAWVLVILILPVLGAVLYLVFRPHGESVAIARSQAIDLDAGTSSGTADEIAKLDGLRKSGVLSEQEFAVQKARVLGMPSPRSAAGEQFTTSSAR